MLSDLGMPARGGRWWRLAAALALVLGLLAAGVGVPGSAWGAPSRPAPGGRAFAWGFDFYGQLGDDLPNADRSSPVGVVGLADVVAVAAGESHSLALTADGRVYAWGNDGNGRLGDGLPLADQSAPVPVALPGGVAAVSIAAGGAHSLALSSGGQVYAWGDDSAGQLGDGLPKANQPVPVPVSLPAGVEIISIAAGGSHSLALTATGQVYAWGADGSGQLGDKLPTTEQLSPVLVANLPAVVAVAAGGAHSLALASGGQVYAWGDDSAGQVGDGPPKSNQPSPVAVVLPPGVTVKAVAAGGAHSLALTSAGQIYAWGNDDDGQLGDGLPSAEQLSPVPVAGLSGMVAIAAGGHHSLALTAGGQIYAWGDGNFGQLGDGMPIAAQPIPVAAVLPGGQAAVAIAAGDVHSLAIGAPRTVTAASGAGTAGGAAMLTAAITRDGVPVPAGGAVTFALNNQAVGTGLTDARGIASVPVPLPAGTQPGTYPFAVQASYGGAVGYAPSQGEGALVVAPASCAARFADVSDIDPSCLAIIVLSDRGVIAGYATDPPTFGPLTRVQRAQVAAFLVRALGWQGRPQGPRTFSDLGPLEGTDLAQAVRIIANSCDSRGNCVAAGFGDGTFGPDKPVTRAEVIALLARAFSLDSKYAWVAQPGAPQPYGGVPAVHDTAIRTYTFYAGNIPDAPTTADGWNGEASRAWVARVLYQALVTKP